MLNTKKLVRMVRQWQKMAALGRRRIAPAGADGAVLLDTSNSSVASRGHVFVYTTDGKRFMVPLTYLNNSIFRELFRMSEEEFGLPSNGPITFSCDAASMEYIISLLQSRVSRGGEGCGCFHRQKPVHNILPGSTRRQPAATDPLWLLASF